MNLNSLLTTKSINKPNYRWLGSMKVNQKIAIGYAVALGISVFGTVLGVTTGNYLEEKALQQEEQALAEVTALYRLQTGVLQVRIHQQQLIPLSKQPVDFDEEYSHIIKHSESIEKGWLQIKLIMQEEEKHSEEEILKLQIFVKTYEEIPDNYLKSLNQLVQEVRLFNLDSSRKITDAQLKLLEFTNSDLAIKFDGISDDLTGIIEIFYQEGKEAKLNVREAIIFRNRITYSGIFVSIIIAIILARKISKAISSPILELNRVAKKVTDSDNFDLQVPVTTEDEVGSLASSFNHLINRVKQLLEEQTANTAHLRAIIDNLAD
ncbi:MAG: HAMP domain-containing protein, partial [Rivularia sp. (in: cyanobacteria)]